MQLPKVFQPSKKKIIILIVLVLGSFLVFNYFNQKKQPKLQLAGVKRQDIQSTVSASGELNGKSVANLKFKISGKLAYLNVKEGDKVTKNQTIAGLDTQDLAIALQQAQNTYRDKQATAEKIEDDVKDHSKDESFTLKATRTTAQAARDTAYDAVKAAQRAFQDAVITSPIDGIVTQAISVSGQTVSTTDLIAQVVDNSKIYFDAEVDEADIGLITEGQTAEVSLNSYPDKTFSGKVKQILSNTETTSSNATVIITKILMDPGDYKNITGLGGQASIIINQASKVLTIPSEALKDDNTVVISTSQGLKTVPVVTGIKSDTDIEIKSGLEEGQQVVLNPS